ERVSAAIAAKTLSRVPPSGATEDAELKALARRREQLERELAADPVLAAELKAIGRPDPVAVRDALPADAALVDLFEYDAPSWAGFFQSGRRLAAFVVRPGRPIARVELGAAEADVIRGFWGGADGTLIELRRERATRGAVRDALPRVRYAHLATHGYVGEAVRRGTDGARPGNPFLITVQGYAPAALSAVALTGANRPAVAEGFLTALELPGLDLSGV